MTCSTAEGMVNRYINHTLSVEELGIFWNILNPALPAMMNWRHILLFMRQCSSLMRKKKDLFWIFSTYWSRI